MGLLLALAASPLYSYKLLHKGVGLLLYVKTYIIRNRLYCAVHETFYCYPKTPNLNARCAKSTRSVLSSYIINRFRHKTQFAPTSAVLLPTLKKDLPRDYLSNVPCRVCADSATRAVFVDVHKEAGERFDSSACAYFLRLLTGTTRWHMEPLDC